MESILTSIKKLLGIAADYTQFDGDIITYINTELATLTRIGVGPSKGFTIISELERWDEFIPDGSHDKCEMLRATAKTYVYAKVKLVFDPPLSSAHIDALKNIAAEAEWRLNDLAESSQ